MAIRLLSAALVLSASTVGLAGTAHAAEPPCGYYQWGSYAHYNHCGSGNVLIRVDRWPGSDEDKCVGPGNTPLGTAPFTQGAYYVRPC